MLASSPAWGAAERNAPLWTVSNRAGDDPRWAAKDWDDRDWEPGNTVPARSGVHWLRFRLRWMAGERPDFRSEGSGRNASGIGPGAPMDSIFLALPASYEVFWDGRRIGGSGVVGATKAEEKPGPLDNLFIVPPELLGPGEHVVAIRLSSYHYNFPAESLQVIFRPSNYAGHYAAEIWGPFFPLLGAGAAGLVAVLSLILFAVAGRWRPLLLCGGLSLCLTIFYLLIAWRWLVRDPYDWFYPRLFAITWIMTVIAGLFPWLLLVKFNVPHRRWWLATAVPLFVLAWGSSTRYEEIVLWLCRAMLVVSLGIGVWAAWKRLPGARFVLAGVVPGLLTVRTGSRVFLDPSFFAVVGVLVVVVFATLGLQLRSDRRRAQEAKLAAARLETELLKKNLQPHFLLNTLAVLTEIVERDPPAAVKLIDDLADGFRTLSRVAAEKLIPLAKELELCRAHLRVMGVRTARAWELATEGVDERAPVPPAMFLTLIENGFTHQRATDVATTFRLRGERSDAGGFRYTFFSPGEVQTEPARPMGGTGLRYVKARLEESFPGRWSLRSGETAGGWETVIEIGATGNGGSA